MNDQTVSLQQLKDTVAEFVRAREWEQFHAPKNLVMAIAVEAAELMELFQWVSVEESKQLAMNPEVKSRVEEELADVFIYCLSLANSMEIDLCDTVDQKMRRNAAKYPVDVYRGSYRGRGDA